MYGPNSLIGFWRTGRLFAEDHSHPCARSRRRRHVWGLTAIQSLRKRICVPLCWAVCTHPWSAPDGARRHLLLFRRCLECWRFCSAQCSGLGRTLFPIIFWAAAQTASYPFQLRASFSLIHSCRFIQKKIPTRYPPPFMDERPDSKNITRLLKDQDFLEMESRLRTKLRMEKKKNAAILRKTPEPGMNDITLDPIERHVERRRLRIGAMLRANLETLMSCNTTQILQDHLGGASVSIVHLEADKSARGTQHVYYVEFFLPSTHTKSNEFDKKGVGIALNSSCVAWASYSGTPRWRPTHCWASISKSSGAAPRAGHGGAGRGANNE